MSERVPSGIPQPQGPGEDPLSHYTRVFLRFLQLVFATFEKGAYKWEPDERLTEITITDQAPVSKEAVEKRPAIVLMRGPMSYANLTVDQFESSNSETGARKHTDLCSCTMTYNILAPEGLEAQRIAHISMMATRRLKRHLMMAGLHRVGEELMMGAESPPGGVVQPDTDEITMVTVTVPFYFQDFWTIEPADKNLLNHIGVALRSELGYPTPDAVPIRAPGMNGKVLKYDKVISLNSKVRVSRQTTPKPR